MPSLTLQTREGKDLTPEGHWRVTYDQQGKPIEQDYSKEFLIWDEEGAFRKGNRKGVGKAFPNELQGKGTRKGNKDKGRSKGKKGRSKGKEPMKGKDAGKGKGQNGNEEP